MYMGIKACTFIWDVLVLLVSCLSFLEHFVLEIDLFILFCALQASADIKNNNQLKSTKCELCWYPCCEHLCRITYILQVHNVYICILLLCSGVRVSLHCCWYTVSQAVQNFSCVGCGVKSPNKWGPCYITAQQWDVSLPPFLLCVRKAFCFFSSLLIAVFLSFVLWYRCVYR
jgi:hypothetical protein